jgi:hypothetical protein
VPEPVNVQPVCDDGAKKIHHTHYSYGVVSLHRGRNQGMMVADGDTTM